MRNLAILLILSVVLLSGCNSNSTEFIREDFKFTKAGKTERISAVVLPINRICSIKSISPMIIQFEACI